MSNTSLLGAYGDNSGSALMFRNKLLNGNFDIWQRGTTPGTMSTSVSAGDYVSADRWKVVGFSAGIGYSAISLTQLTTGLPVGSRFGAKVASTTAAADSLCLGQYIESMNCYSLVGKPVTISVKLKKLAGFDAGTPISISLHRLSSPDVGPTYFDAPAAAQANQTTLLSSYSHTLTTSDWETVVFTTGVLSAEAVNGLLLHIVYSKTDMGASEKFAIAQAQLEAGTTATPFEYRFIGTELALCQRYYEKSYELDDKPGTDVTAVTPTKRGALNFYTHSDGSSDSGCQVFYKVTKRKANNTVNVWTASGTVNAVYRSYSGGAAAITPFISYNSSNSVWVLADEGGVPAWTNTLVEFCWTCDAEI